MFELLVDRQVVPHFLGSGLKLEHVACKQFNIRKSNNNSNVIDEASLGLVSTSSGEQLCTSYLCQFPYWFPMVGLHAMFSVPQTIDLYRLTMSHNMSNILRLYARPRDSIRA